MWNCTCGMRALPQKAMQVHDAGRTVALPLRLGLQNHVPSVFVLR